MLRRDLLKGMLATLVIAPNWTYQAAAASSQRRPFHRVRPGEPGWPAAGDWDDLAHAVGGRLSKVQAPFGVCADGLQQPDCIAAIANIKNPFYLGDQAGGTQISGWLDAWTPAPSAYVVAAGSTEDIVAAVNFARNHNLRLVVKGAGHSYQGTSNAPDSLLVWTRAMNAVLLHDAFIPEGCEGMVAPSPAVSAGAGAVWIDLYHAVTSEAGRYVQGGGCADVGVAGLVQSGGFGSFSKAFGTAAANLLEAEIVTADGEVRIANAGTNADLFWALKGGGGGSWGVVTRLTLRTHTLPQFLGGAWGTIHAKSDDAFRRLVDRFLAFYAEALHNPHWGEQVRLAADNSLTVSMVCQGLDTDQANAAWRPFFDWVKATPGDYSLSDAHGAGVKPARKFWDVGGNPDMIPDPRPGVPDYHGWSQGDKDQVGAFLHGYESLWLASSLLGAPERPRLCQALIAASRHKRVALHFNKGLSGAPEECIAAARNTATNPSMIEAFALAIIAGGERPRYPGLPQSFDLDAAREDAHAIDRALIELTKVAPNGGSYVSESNYFNPQWQKAYWGDNYAMLSAIKGAFDPDGLFFVHNGVGSEAWSADGFARL